MLRECGSDGLLQRGVGSRALQLQFGGHVVVEALGGCIDVGATL
jgi:hypothetical protein